MANDAQEAERIASIIRENLSGVTSTDPDIRAAQEDDLMRTAELIAADLCASGQQVRALIKAGRAMADAAEHGFVASTLVVDWDNAEATLTPAPQTAGEME